MDATGFDALSRRIASRLTRRAALGGFVAGVAALLQDRAQATPDDHQMAPASAGCLTSGATCGLRGAPRCCTGTACAGGVCCPSSQNAIDRCCAPGQVACFKSCCPPETIACGAPTVLPDGTVLPSACVCPYGSQECNGHCIGGELSGSACTADCECFYGLCCDGVCCGDDGICLDGACHKVCQTNADCSGVKGNNAACIDGLCCNEWDVCGRVCCSSGTCQDGVCIG